MHYKEKGGCSIAAAFFAFNDIQKFIWRFGKFSFGDLASFHLAIWQKLYLLHPYFVDGVGLFKAFALEAGLRSPWTSGGIAIVWIGHAGS